MKSTHSLSVIATALVFSVSLARGQEGPNPSAHARKMANWSAPAFWEPSARGAFEVSGEQVSLGQLGPFGAAVTSPLPFIGIEPCRIADTRGNDFGDQAGPPALSSNVTRTFQIGGTVPGAPTQCGIPLTAQAVSFQFTIIQPSAEGNLIAWPSGPPPSTSVLNWPGAIFSLGNGIVVPVSETGGLNVFVNAAFGALAHLTIDVNGYYAPAGIGIGNTFLGLSAGNFTMTGNFNTGLGNNALVSNTTGGTNTATGAGALVSNTSGLDNTATGAVALLNNTIGVENTATGAFALNGNTTVSGNTAIGFTALFSNTAGVGNTVIGSGALQNSTGSNNIGIGIEAGINLTTGNDNIDIANAGVAFESATIRIGTGGSHARAFLAGVRGVATGANDAVNVVIDSAGQLGTALFSSRRIKEAIAEMGDRTDRLLQLRPVTFRYKPEFDPSGTLRYGLIAEEVAEVFPELVVFDLESQPETVRYDVLPSLLLNETAPDCGDAGENDRAAAEN